MLMYINGLKTIGEIIMATRTNSETATFGAGCFWCVEAVFQRLKGVRSVTSGYSGGNTENPTYKDICSGTTGHAEVCQIEFDSEQITYTELLQAFFSSHDPTTLNQQGADKGTQYRSVIFYHNDEQKLFADKIKHELDTAGVFNGPIVTEIVPFSKFYIAEDYHQNYFNDNGNQPYCAVVIRPKLDKFKKVFKEKLKTEER
ncbi:peptide-methionine (S)-S-oxide reductase MsrA [bacterium]|nr:peptide-methionine (S)-S-oxide reductase MsrA [bacterium]